MSGKRYWNIAIAAFILLAATTLYVSAGFEDEGGSLADNHDRKNIIQQQQSPTETATPSKVEATIAPGTSYTVQSGDTLGEISRKAYGSPNYWSAICILNSLPDCGRIEVGDTLTIPTNAQADTILAGTPTAEPAQVQTPSLAATASSTATPKLTIGFPLSTVPAGTWITGEEVPAGMYSAPGGDQCSWKRLSGFSGTSDDIIAEGFGEIRPIVEIAETDKGFATMDCGNWTVMALKLTQTPTPSTTPVPPAQIVTVPQGWSTIVNDRLGYTLAVPHEWMIFDLQSDQLSQVLRSVDPGAADQLEDAVNGPGGEYAGHLAVEVTTLAKQPLAALAGVGIFPNLDDDISSESLVDWLGKQLAILPLPVPVEIQSLEASTINNLPSIQGIASADLSSQGLFNAHLVMTALRTNDTAYILLIATREEDAGSKLPLINQIISTFQPMAAASIAMGTPTETRTSRAISTPAPTATPSATPTATPTSHPIAIVTISMNIRSGPDTSYDIVGTAKAGQQFAIIGKNAAGDWWQISIKGKPAWIYAPMVESEGTAGVTVVDAPPTSTPSPTSTRPPTATPRPTATQPPTATPRPTAPPVRPGTHRVGLDIQPGLYIGLAGQGFWDSCYWERLKDLSGTLDSIIANDNVEGLFYVEILPSDKAFSTDCDVIAINQVDPPSSPFTKVPPGMYLVGRDILPGLYRGQAPRGDWCYWERLSDATGELYSILANDNAEGQYFVSVARSDFAVRFDCPVERVE